MEVKRARTAGFCMGVSLALKRLDKALDEAGDCRIVTLGPIIHNPQVLQGYATRGVVCLNSPDQVQASDCVVIRAHGIPVQVQQHLHRVSQCIVDATCPKVKKAQLAIADATSNGAKLLLFGEEDHPEVRGLVSQAPYGYHVFDSIDGLLALPLSPQGAYVLASQTTQEKTIFDSIEIHLRTQYPDMPVLYTICDATCERQKEAVNIAKQVQVMVVVGGRDSGNTRRLADVVKAQGIPTFHVEVVEELDVKKFAEFSSVGLTAGASTPKSLIDAVQNFLHEC